MSPNAGGGVGVAAVAGSHPMSTAVHRSPNKLWRSCSIFNPHDEYLLGEFLILEGELERVPRCPGVMDQISIKTSNLKCRLFLKIYQ